MKILIDTNVINHFTKNGGSIPSLGDICITPDIVDEIDADGDRNSRNENLLTLYKITDEGSRLFVFDYKSKILKYELDCYQKQVPPNINEVVKSARNLFNGSFINFLKNPAQNEFNLLEEHREKLTEGKEFSRLQKKELSVAPTEDNTHSDRVLNKTNFWNEKYIDIVKFFCRGILKRLGSEENEDFCEHIAKGSICAPSWQGYIVSWILLNELAYNRRIKLKRSDLADLRGISSVVLYANKFISEDCDLRALTKALNDVFDATQYISSIDEWV